MKTSRVVKAKSNASNKTGIGFQPVPVDVR